MTLRELSQLYYLSREIEADKRRLEEVKSRLSVSGQKLSDMPRAANHKNHMECYVAELIDLERIISAKTLQCTSERNRLERYIAEIPDSLTRQIFTLRFVNGLNWVQIAYSIGGGNTEEGVRKRAYRQIKQADKKENKRCPKMSGQI